MTVDGSTFDVRVRGKRAEVVRRNAEYAPRLGRMRGRAVFAMERASGCEVVRISGDAAQLRGDLDCGDGPPPRRPIGLSAEFSCLTLDGYISPATEELVLDLDCYPI